MLAMPKPILILRLEGVLQSWGERARWDFRDSNTMPTKSGVVGLLACAMGLPRGSERIIELSKSLEMGVRADRNGVIFQDFHTVTGERDFLFNAEGKKRVGGATIITPRQYLQDAYFTVALYANEELLNACATALNNPVWSVYLGRKSCVPSRPIFDELTNEYSSILEALESHPLCMRPSKNQTFLCEYEDKSGNILRRDEIQFNAARNYDYRRVKCTAIEIQEV